MLSWMLLEARTELLLAFPFRSSYDALYKEGPSLQATFAGTGARSFRCMALRLAEEHAPSPSHENSRLVRVKSFSCCSEPLLLPEWTLQSPGPLSREGWGHSFYTKHRTKRCARARIALCIMVLCRASSTAGVHTAVPVELVAVWRTKSLAGTLGCEWWYLLLRSVSSPSRRSVGLACSPPPAPWGAIHDV